MSVSRPFLPATVLLVASGAAVALASVAMWMGTEAVAGAVGMEGLGLIGVWFGALALFGAAAVMVIVALVMLVTRRAPVWPCVAAPLLYVVGLACSWGIFLSGISGVRPRTLGLAGAAAGAGLASVGVALLRARPVVPSAPARTTVAPPGPRPVEVSVVAWGNVALGTLVGLAGLTAIMTLFMGLLLSGAQPWPGAGWYALQTVLIAATAALLVASGVRLLSARRGSRTMASVAYGCMAALAVASMFHEPAATDLLFIGLAAGGAFALRSPRASAWLSGRGGDAPAEPPHDGP